jgi:hypothetical protein
LSVSDRRSENERAEVLPPHAAGAALAAAFVAAVDTVIVVALVYAIGYVHIAERLDVYHRDGA